MANKKISELAVRTPSLTDLMLVGDPSTGYSYKATLSSLSTLLEANIALDDLNDVTITSPTAGQVLSYNGTAWVNDTNGITGTGTTNYLPKFTSSSAIGNSTLQTDANYNFGINVTPNSNWGSSYDVLQINNSSSFFGSGNETILADNIYIDASNNYRYLTTAGASYYRQTFGQHYWYSISSGTAGNIINTPSLMFFSNSGSLGIGTLGPTAKLDVNGDVKIATIANATTDTDRFIVSDGGVIKYRTGAEVLSDIGGAAASSISGTTNYIPKFTSSSAIGNSGITDDGSTITFSTSATERMRLNSSGNLGLGTSSPNQRLTVAVAQIANTVMPVLKLTTTGAYSGAGSSDAGASVEFGQYHDTYPNWVLGQISAIRSGASWDGALLFYTNNGTAETNKTERMRITSGGNVGIGVTNPGSYNAGGNQLVIGGGAFRGLTIAGTTEGNIYFADGTTGTETYRGSVGYNHTSDYLFFYSAANERMRITSGGNVLVGTTTDAGYKLNVSGDVNVGSTNGYYFGGTSTAIYRSTADLRFYVNSGDRMSITSGGNVGIGTTTPTAYSGYTTLAINNATNGGLIDFMRNGVVDVQLVNNPTTASFEISSFTVGRSINFLTNGGFERMRITSGGELLINTTTDAGDFKLQVSGNAYVSGSVGIGSTSTSNGLLTIAGTAPRAINMAATFTGGTSRFGILQNNTVNSDVTSSAVNNYSQFATQAAAFTLTTASHYTIAGITIGAGSSVTNQIGYRATNITEATNNYGFYGEIASGTGRWNLYMVGTANNYMNGNLGIGVTTPTEKLEVNGAIKTAAPSGGTAKPFKIGAAATVTPTSQNRTIEIEIDGTTYYLTAKTTND